MTKILRLLLILILAASPVEARNLFISTYGSPTADGTNPALPTTLRNAIDNLEEDDHLFLQEGTYTTGEDGTPFIIKHGCHIIGGCDPYFSPKPQAFSTITKHADITVSRLFVVSKTHFGPPSLGEGNVIFRNITFLDATALYESEESPYYYHNYGAALYIDSAAVFLNKVTFRNNRALRGGAIYLGPGASLQLEEVAQDIRFEQNSAQLGGAIFIDTATYCSLRDVALLDNKASQAGGALFSLGGDISLRNATVENNSATVRGGAFAHHNGRLTLYASSVAHNSALQLGGAVYLSGNGDNPSTFIVDGASVFHDNFAGGLASNTPFAYGGALYAGVFGNDLDVPTATNINIDLRTASFYHNTASLISPLSGKTILDLSKGGAFFIEPGVKQVSLAAQDKLHILDNYTSIDDTFAFDLASNIFPVGAYSWQVAFSTANVPGKTPSRKQTHLVDFPKGQPISISKNPVFPPAENPEYLFDKLIVTSHILPAARIDTFIPIFDAYTLNPTSHFSVKLPPSFIETLLPNHICVAPDADDPNASGASWNDPLSLTLALDFAKDGDTLLLKEGTYTYIEQTNTFSIIDKSITLRGGFSGDGLSRSSNPANTIISANGQCRTLYIQSSPSRPTPINVTLQGLTLTQGSIDASPTIDTVWGGANLLISKAHVTLLDCRVTDGHTTFQRSVRETTGWQNRIYPFGAGISVIDNAKLSLGKVTISANVVVEQGSQFSSQEESNRWNEFRRHWPNYGPAIYFHLGTTFEALNPLDINIWDNLAISLIGGITDYLDYSSNNYFSNPSRVCNFGEPLFYPVVLDWYSFQPYFPRVYDEVANSEYSTGNSTTRGRTYSVPRGTPFRFQPAFPNGILRHPGRIFNDPRYLNAFAYTGDPDASGTAIDVPLLPGESSIRISANPAFRLTHFYALPKGVGVDLYIPTDYLSYADGSKPSLALPPNELFTKSLLHSADTVLFAPMPYQCSTPSSLDSITFLGKAFRVPQSFWTTRDPHHNLTSIEPSLTANSQISPYPILSLRNNCFFKAVDITFRGARVALSHLPTEIFGGGALFIGENAEAVLHSVSFEDNVALDFEQANRYGTAVNFNHARGGAIYLRKGATLRLKDVSFTHNAALDTTFPLAPNLPIPLSRYNAAYGGALFVEPDGNTSIETSGFLYFNGNRAIRPAPTTTSTPYAYGYGGAIAFGTSDAQDAVTSITPRFANSFPHGDSLSIYNNHADHCPNVFPYGPTHSFTLLPPAHPNLAHIEASLPYGYTFDLRTDDYLTLHHSDPLPSDAAYIIDSTRIHALVGDSLHYIPAFGDTLHLSIFNASVDLTSLPQGASRTSTGFALSASGLRPLSGERKRFFWEVLDPELLLTSPRLPDSQGGNIEFMSALKAGSARIKFTYQSFVDTLLVSILAPADPLSLPLSSNFFPLHLDPPAFQKLSPFLIQDLRPASTPVLPTPPIGSSTKSETLRVTLDNDVASLYRLRTHASDFAFHLAFLTPSSNEAGYTYQYTLRFSNGTGHYDFTLSSSIPREHTDNYLTHLYFPPDDSWHLIDIPLKDHPDLCQLFPQLGSTLPKGTPILAISNADGTPIPVLGVADHTKKANFAELYFYTPEATPSKLAFVACPLDGGAPSGSVTPSYDGGADVSSNIGNVSLFSVKAEPTDLIFPLSPSARWTAQELISRFHVDTFPAYMSDLSSPAQNKKLYISLSARKPSDKMGTIQDLFTLNDYGKQISLTNYNTPSATFPFPSDSDPLHAAGFFPLFLDQASFNFLNQLPGEGTILGDLRPDDVRFSLDLNDFTSYLPADPRNAFGFTHPFLAFSSPQPLAALSFHRTSDYADLPISLHPIHQLSGNRGALHIAFRSPLPDASYSLTFTVADPDGNLRDTTIAFGNLFDVNHRSPSFDFLHDDAWHAYSLPISSTFGNFFKDAFLPTGTLTPYLSIAAQGLPNAILNLDALFFYKPDVPDITGISFSLTSQSGSDIPLNGGSAVDLHVGDIAFLHTKTLPDFSFALLSFETSPLGAVTPCDFDPVSGRIFAHTPGSLILYCKASGNADNIEGFMNTLIVKVLPYDPSKNDFFIEALNGNRQASPYFSDSLTLTARPDFPDGVTLLEHRWSAKPTHGNLSSNRPLTFRNLDPQGRSVSLYGFTPGTSLQVWDSIFFTYQNANLATVHDVIVAGPFPIDVPQHDVSLRISSTLTAPTWPALFPSAHYQTPFYIALSFSPPSFTDEAIAAGFSFQTNGLADCIPDPDGDPLAFRITPTVGDTLVSVYVNETLFSFSVPPLPISSIDITDNQANQQAFLSYEDQLPLRARTIPLDANQFGIAWSVLPQGAAALTPIPGIPGDSCRLLTVLSRDSLIRVIARPRYATSDQVADTFRIKVDSLRLAAVNASQTSGSSLALPHDSILEFAFHTSPLFATTPALQWTLSSAAAEFVDANGLTIPGLSLSDTYVRIRASRPIQANQWLSLTVAAPAPLPPATRPASASFNLFVPPVLPDSLRLLDASGSTALASILPGSTFRLSANFWPRDVSDKRLSWTHNAPQGVLTHLSSHPLASDTAAFFAIAASTLPTTFTISATALTPNPDLPLSQSQADFNVSVLNVPVSQLSLSASAPSVEIYTSLTLEAHLAPINASNPSILWTISDPSIAAFVGETQTSTHSDGYLVFRRTLQTSKTGAFTVSVSAQDQPGFTASSLITCTSRPFRSVSLQFSDDVPSPQILPYDPQASRGIRAVFDPPEIGNQSLAWRLSPSIYASFLPQNGAPDNQRRVAPLRAGVSFYVIIISPLTPKEDSILITVPPITPQHIILHDQRGPQHSSITLDHGQTVSLSAELSADSPFPVTLNEVDWTIDPPTAAAFLSTSSPLELSRSVRLHASSVPYIPVTVTASTRDGSNLSASYTIHTTSYPLQLILHDVRHLDSVSISLLPLQDVILTASILGNAAPFTTKSISWAVDPPDAVKFLAASSQEQAISRVVRLAEDADPDVPIAVSLSLTSNEGGSLSAQYTIFPLVPTPPTSIFPPQPNPAPARTTLLSASGRVLAAFPCAPDLRDLPPLPAGIYFLVSDAGTAIKFLVP